MIINQVAPGKWSTLASSYDSSTKTVSLDTSDVAASWYGAFEPELLYEASWSKKVTDAANWPLTPTTTAQALTWVTEYTATANANATFDRYGKNYHGGAALDFGVYNYIWLEDGYVDYFYDSDEATLGTVHVSHTGFEMAYHHGARPRSSNGAIVLPTTSTYGSYGTVNIGSSLCIYRNASNVLNLANNCTYGVSAAAIGPSISSTTRVNPDYVNLRIPSFGIRAHDTYMPTESYSDLNFGKTTLNYRVRLYRVPVEQGIYTIQNARLLELMQSKNFPAETI